MNPAGHLAVPFHDPERAVPQIVEFAREHPLAAVIAADDDGVELAAIAALRLGLPHHPVDAVRAARNKRSTREQLTSAGLYQPRFVAGHATGLVPTHAHRLQFPVVVKPAKLAASQGVIRADDPASLAAAWERTATLLRALHPSAAADSPALDMLVEEFVPGAEVAVEGLMTNGVLRTVAIFEKPDPLDGPYFEETLYLTPPRLLPGTRDRITHEVQRAALAIGLGQGPVHAELRLSLDGPVILEIAPRSIGGLCSRTLTFGDGESLEMLLLRHALGEDVDRIERDSEASGVMMIPIPRAGTLTGVTGEENARSVPAIEDIRITMTPGSDVVPLPEGGRYLGFIFARAKDTDRVERALRAAHEKLTFEITPPAGGREGVFA